MAPVNKPKVSMARNLAVTAGLLISSLTIILLTFLASGLFTMPYLTPLAHFLAKVVQPLVPFLAPVTIGILIKVMRSQEMKELSLRRVWGTILGCQLPQHLERVW